jgi:hypothetical protein
VPERLISPPFESHPRSDRGDRDPGGKVDRAMDRPHDVVVTSVGPQTCADTRRRAQDHGMRGGRTDPADTRYYRISLTSRGWRVKPNMDEIVHDALESLPAGPTDGERRAAFEFSRRMAAGLRQASQAP